MDPEIAFFVVVGYLATCYFVLWLGGSFVFFVIREMGNSIDHFKRKRELARREKQAEA